MRYKLLSVIILYSCWLSAQTANPCPAGFTALLRVPPVNGGQADLPSRHIGCYDLNGNFDFEQLVFMRGAFAQSRTVRPSTTPTALPGDGVTAVTNTAARSVTLTMATAGMQALSQVAWYTIVDEAGTGATANVTITPASGTVSGAANVKITSNFGVWTGYCTSTACFTLSLR